VKKCLKNNDAKDNNLILVMGITGSGKSTTINYLLGHKIVERRGIGYDVDIGNIIGEHSSQVAEIGNDNYKSATLYAQCYSNNRSSAVYCDCPGFLDSRGIEEQIVVEISRELAVKMCKSVAGIIMVIDYSSIISSRGQAFKQLCTILNELFIDINKINDSIIFIITKTNMIPAEKN